LVKERKRKVAILGSTGSVGQKSLKVIERFPDLFDVYGLSCHRNVELLSLQVETHRPKLAVVADLQSFPQFKCPPRGTEVLSGVEGILELVSRPEVDLVMNALVGSAGALPTIRAVENGKDVALANKESLVMAGEIIMPLVERGGTEIIPVDSEHSAIHQCLRAGRRKELKRIILTASGGPFWKNPGHLREGITRKEALSHPTWEMGEKITIDSATLMNKGLEVIEAHWLFGLSPSKIQVLIHPQSVVHSLVEFVDGSLMAQLAPPDMEIPIQYALTLPHRFPMQRPDLDLAKVGSLTFDLPPKEDFPCLDLAYRAIEKGGTMPAVLNGADEVAVDAFLKGKIQLSGIPDIVGKAMDLHNPFLHPNWEKIWEAHKWAQERGGSIIEERMKG